MSGIDHLVICVEDLDAARALYQAAGFTMAPKAQHPFGTGNSNIQLQGSFLEVLTVMEPADIVPATSGHFSFSAFNRDFLARRQGASMLVLESADTGADLARYRAHNLQTFAPFEFSRQAGLPDGSAVTVGFSLAFAVDPGMPDAAFFTCRQHAPEHFWKTEYQRHANTARSLAEVAIVSDHPASHRAFLAGFTGIRHADETAGRLTVSTPRGDVSVMTPALFEDRYRSISPDLGNGARLAGFTVNVDELGAVAKCLDRAGPRYNDAGDRITVCASELMGVAAAFTHKAH